MLKHWYKKLEKNVRNPKKLSGTIFVLALFAIVGLISSQAALLMALKWRLSG